MKFNIKSLLRSLGYFNEEKWGDCVFFDHPRGKVYIDYFPITNPSPYLCINHRFIYCGVDAKIEDIKASFIENKIVKAEFDFNNMKSQSEFYQLTLISKNHASS